MDPSMTGHLIRRSLLALSLLLPLSGLIGCQSTMVETAETPVLTDYDRPLPPGQRALRLITDPARLPDLEAAYREHSAIFMQSLERSIGWFDKPSSLEWFPMEGVSHARAKASVIAMREVLASSTSPQDFARRVRSTFDVYESVGYDGSGTVLFTGYYSPEFAGSPTRTARFTAPLYRRPADLATDPRTGAPLGRQRADGTTTSYPSRREIERSGMLAGTEIAWVEDRLAAYLIHVNGSAKLRLPDGSTMHIGYDGKTDRPYRSLGKAIIREGLAPADGMSITAIRRLYRKNPAPIDELMNENESFVFFTEYAGSDWPAGSLGVRVSPECSLATDKTIFPRGGVVLVDTHAPRFTGGLRPYARLMLDQDTGGAIRAPGRADIFMGIGETVGILAGRQHAEGQLYYFFVRDDGAS